MNAPWGIGVLPNCFPCPSGFIRFITDEEDTAMKISALLLSLLLATTLTACGKKEEPKTAEAPPAAGPEVAPPMPMAPSEGVAGSMANTNDAQGLFAAKCAGCHGKTGEGVGDNPKLVGLTSDQIKSKLMDYKAGKTLGPKTAIMASMAKGLSDEQINALASYLGE
jgi:cytochrome c553